MDNKEMNSDEVIRAALGFGTLLGLVFAGPVIGLGWYLWKRPRLIRELGHKNLLITGTIMILIGALVWFLWLDRFPLYELDWLQHRLIGHLTQKFLIQILVGIWWSGVGLICLMAPLAVALKRIPETIRLGDFRHKVKNFRQVFATFSSLYAAPIGIDVRTGLVVTLNQDKRKAHVLILGATGSGKTTLLVNLALHAVFHNQPLVILDPKGEDSTLDEFIRIGRAMRTDFDSRFRLFTISRPELSSSYNPLKHGNANHLKDRLMEALCWSEQYYQSIAGEFLSTLTSCTEWCSGAHL